jgi:hypothetical protein
MEILSQQGIQIIAEMFKVNDMGQKTWKIWVQSPELLILLQKASDFNIQMADIFFIQEKEEKWLILLNSANQFFMTPNHVFGSGAAKIMNVKMVDASSNPWNHLLCMAIT